MRYAVAALLALFASSLFAAEPPLPEGAVARLGTTKFRAAVSAICLSPDGTRLAIRVGDGIDVMNLESGEIVTRIRDEKQLTDPKLSRGPHWYSFAFAPGGKEIVSAHGGGEVKVWDAETGKFLRGILGPLTDDPEKRGVKIPAKVYSVVNCQLADFVVCETWNGVLKLDVKAGKWTEIGGFNYRLGRLSPDGRWATEYTDMASIENYIGVIDTKTGKRVYDAESGGAYPFNSVTSPDGKLVACTTDEAGVQVWNIATKKEIKLKDVNPKITHGAPVFSPDGKTVIVALPYSVYEENIQPHFARWDVTTGERLKDWKMPVHIGSWIIDHKNNRLVAFAGQGAYRIDLATGKMLSPPEGFVGYTRPALSPDGKLAAVGDEAGVIRVWEVPSARPEGVAPFDGKPRTLRENGSAIHDLQFSKDSKTLYVGYADRTAGVWDIAKGKETTVLKPPAGKLRDRYGFYTMNIAASPDGKVLIGEVGTARMWGWEVSSGKVLWEVSADEDGKGVTGCRPAFAPDGSGFYYGGEKATVSKYDHLTGKPLATTALPDAPKWSVSRVALSPNERYVAASLYTGDGHLALLDTETGKAPWSREFKYEQAIGDLVFAPNGATVITTHSDGTIRGWNTKDGEPAFVLSGPKGYIGRLQLTADGKYAITDAPGATALVWKLPQK